MWLGRKAPGASRLAALAKSVPCSPNAIEPRELHEPLKAPFDLVAHVYVMPGSNVDSIVRSQRGCRVKVYHGVHTEVLARFEDSIVRRAKAVGEE